MSSFFSKTPASKAIRVWAGCGLLACIVSLTACGGEDGSGDTKDLYQWQLPKGFPEPRQASEKRLTNAQVEFERLLFYDRRMSINETMSWADGHFQSMAFTDGKTKSVGARGTCIRATPCR